MSKIANTIICYGIAIILLCFGMRFDEAEALFYTRNVGLESVAEGVCAGRTTISEVDSTSTKLVGTKNESQTGQIIKQSQNMKRDAKMLFCILTVADLGNFISNSDQVTCEIKSVDLYHRVVVLNYIHDLDGKKRV